MVASFVLLDGCLTLRAWPALFLNVSLAEIRASQVKQKLKNFEQLMNRGPRALSHSQNTSVNVYLGRLFDMLQITNCYLREFW